MAQESNGADTFQPNHRAGYGDRLAWVLGWLERHPDSTLHSGEGALLLAYIRQLEAQLGTKLTHNKGTP